MKSYLYFLFCISLGFIQNITSVASETQVQCLECTQISKPEDCLKSIRCEPGEICMAEQYITDSGHVFYDVGCKQASICTAAGFNVSSAELQRRRASHLSSVPVVGKRKRASNIALHVCQECCEESFCNNYLCGGHETNILKCASCSESVDVSVCETAEACHPYETCFIEEIITDLFELRYNTGCMRERQCQAVQVSRQTSGNSVSGLCFNCCNSSYCNLDCSSALATSSVMKPTTIATGGTRSIANNTLTKTKRTPSRVTSPTITGAATAASIITTPLLKFTTESTAKLRTTTSIKGNGVSTQAPAKATTPIPAILTSVETQTSSITTGTTGTTHIPVPVCQSVPPLATVLTPAVKQTILNSIGCGGKDDVVFLVDSSSSVKNEEEHYFEFFTKAYIDTLDIGPNKARVGYAYYNSAVTEVLHLDKGDNSQVIDNSLMKLAQGSDTTENTSLLGAALNHVVRDMFSGTHSRREARKFLVLLTKSESDDIDDAVKAAENARQGGVEIVMVGVGNFDKTLNQMVKMVNTPKSDFFVYKHTFDELGTELEDLIIGHCKDHTSLPTIAPVPCTGHKFIDLVGCGAKEDLTFILDKSSSIHQEDWVTISQFVHKLVETFDMSPSASRFGMMTFNNQLEELIHFRDFSNKQKLLQDIDSKLKAEPGTGSTQTHLALEKTIEWYKNSFRPGAKQVAVIFTDGGSDSKFRTLASALELHRLKVTVFVVGIGHHVDLKEQMILATDPDVEHMVNVHNFDGLLNYLEYLAVVRCKGPPLTSTLVL